MRGISYRFMRTAVAVILSAGLIGLVTLSESPVALAKAKPSQVTMEGPASSLPTDQVRALVKLINSERAKVGLSALRHRDDISQVARKHALDMIQSGFFSHISPTAGTLARRLRAGRIKFARAGENLAGCATVETAHKLLMESPSHSANILDPRFTELGVAVVEGGPYGMMIVEVFVSEPAETPAAEETP